MNKMTIKLKITLWFTIFMIILSVIVFVFISLVSNSTTSQEVQGGLSGFVDRNMKEVEYDDGELDIEDDYISFENGIYCSIFDEDGVKINGYLPYAELEEEAFEDGSVRSVQINDETYLIYDRKVSAKGEDDLWLRGAVPADGSSVASGSIHRTVLICLPVLIILAALGGYLFAGHSLRPIKKINKIAEDIGKSGDLSKRIEIESNGDELHQLAGTFNNMFKRLEANFESERNFTSDASHELRTPVSTILAQCEYAFENASNEQELYEAIGAIQKQGYRMSHIIESLLQFTRVEQRTEGISFETIDLSALVLSVCNEQKVFSERSITLTSNIQTDIKMKADIPLIARMLENLIRNAYRYGKENGTINVDLKKNEQGIVLSVIDDGIGIAPEELPKIWNRFYRVDKSRNSSKGTGLGLGLAMVKQIAELHGGKAEVNSVPQKGSIFIIRFF